MNNEQAARAIQVGWVYAKTLHPIIGLEYATRITDQGPEMMTSDRVYYTAREKHFFENGGGNQLVHDLKRVFSGVLIGVNDCAI